MSQHHFSNKFVCSPSLLCSSWTQCNGVLSLGYTGAYFSSTSVSLHIDSLKKLSPDVIAALVEAYCERVTQCKLSLLRQVFLASTSTPQPNLQSLLKFCYNSLPPLLQSLFHFCNNSFPLPLQFSHAARPLYCDRRLPRDMAFKGPKPEIGFHVFRGA